MVVSLPSSEQRYFYGYHIEPEWSQTYVRSRLKDDTRTGAFTSRGLRCLKEETGIFALDIEDAKEYGQTEIRERMTFALTISERESWEKRPTQCNLACLVSIYPTSRTFEARVFWKLREWLNVARRTFKAARISSMGGDLGVFGTGVWVGGVVISVAGDSSADTPFTSYTGQWGATTPGAGESGERAGHKPTIPECKVQTPMRLTKYSCLHHSQRPSAST
ncbi:hypothetical protein BV22DRAFT_1050394 [Leucogyrophana mollusca]|uniref:Uncharacterized protein n=1 Tax=Leucogyrophana mollusca TaxID=85980 RepID=A0ACB8B5A6_9AGAM|nr:hypothetical protein BV22DRAFT_1050394 [Leucogyrophana mollusca]